jgi:hypothetical protein
LAKAGLIDESQLRRSENSGVQLFRKYGLLISVAAFLLALTCSAGWNGNPVPNSGSWASIFGLVPVSDAYGYFVSPVQESVTGHWNAIASRRPLAAGLRQLLMLAGGYSNLHTLLLQDVAIAAALFFAVRSVVLWRGLWCGIAFAGLLYGIARPFLPTMLTEPLALFWALLSVGFTVEAIRLKSLPHAYVALTTFAIAEVIRMGSMFTIPAFVLWIVIAFGTDARNRFRLAATGVALVGLVAVIQTALGAMYGDPSSFTGANFPETLCGLAAGRDWTACPTLYANELQHLSTERLQAAFFTAKAIHLIRESPYPMLARMFANVRELLTGMPRFLLYGIYTYNRYFAEFLFILLLVPGIYMAWRNRARGEASFWILFFVSLIGSVALIFADDGWRVMHSTWPFVALFFCLGFTGPLGSSAGESVQPLISARAGALLIAVSIILAAGAPAVARIWPGVELVRTIGTARPYAAETAILDGRSLSGFLVVADNAALPDRVPAIHASQFAQFVKTLDLESTYARFVDRAMARVPFAFITAAVIPDYREWYFLLAPAEILTNGTKRAWLVKFAGPLDTPETKIVPEISAVRALDGASQGQAGL